MVGLRAQYRSRMASERCDANIEYCISKLALPYTGLYRAAQHHRHHRKVPTIAELYSMVPTCT